MKAGDDVTLEQLHGEHVRLWVERCPTLQEAAQHLGVNPRMLAMQLLQRHVIAGLHW